MRILPGSVICAFNRVCLHFHPTLCSSYSFAKYICIGMKGAKKQWYNLALKSKSGIAVVVEWGHEKPMQLTMITGKRLFGFRDWQSYEYIWCTMQTILHKEDERVVSYFFYYQWGGSPSDWTQCHLQRLWYMSVVVKIPSASSVAANIFQFKPQILSLMKRHYGFCTQRDKRLSYLCRILLKRAALFSTALIIWFESLLIPLHNFMVWQA